MTHLLFYSVKEYVACKIYHCDWKHSDVFRGYKCLKEFGKNNRKSLYKILKEVNTLCKYWHCFPDMYFRFGHFLKEFSDFETIKSFVPQKAYSAFCSKGPESTAYAVLINDKVVFHDLMNYYKLPVPEMYFVFNGNRFVQGGGAELTDSQVDSILASIKSERIFVKKYTGGAASGVSIIENINGKLIYQGETVNAKFIRKEFGGCKTFFEKQLIQEPILRSFNPDTVNTIRVMTLNINDTPRVISAAVRFGRKGGFVDNTAKGGVAVSLDIETGVLGDWGIREYNLNKFYEHPDSKKKFGGVLVEQWPAVKELVLRTLKFLPEYRSVGFDVVTTEDGPCIIEINTGAGIYLSQMGKEKGLADYFGNSIFM